MSGTRVGPPGPPGRDRSWYPMFVDLEGRRCLVVGGGPVATERTLRLADHGAVVRLVSPEVTPQLAGMVASGAVAEHRARAYRSEDIDGCLLAIAATDREDVNRTVWQDAEERDVVCNVVTDPALCTFIAPSLVRRGELAIAVSTGGASPVVSAHVRRRLDAMFGPEWADLVRLMGEVRRELRTRHPGADDRREAVERLMGSDVPRLLAEGDGEGARALARRVLDIEGVVA